MANELDRLRADVGALVASHAARTKATDFAQYADDPVGFLREVLHCTPWEAQAAMAVLVRDHPRACIVSANSVGKDWLMARVALWWVYARRGFVVFTSATDRQARAITMKEVRRAFLATPALPGELFQMELRVTDSSGILAFTSDAIEKLVGFHHPRLLLALSEGQGLDPQVFEAAFACATGEQNRIVAYGNPTVVGGAFHSAATSGRWATLTVPASEHPNIIEGREVIPGGPSREWMAAVADEYGITSSIYRSRVLSEWPDESVEGLLKRSWIEAAFARHESGVLDEAARRYRPPGAEDPDHPLSALQGTKLGGYNPLLSVDVSRYGGDRSVLAVCRGPVVSEFAGWRGASITDSADLVEHHADRLRTNRAVAPCRLVVDGAGLGAGLVDVLRARGRDVTDYLGGSKSHRPARYFNRRTQDYWRLRELLERGEIALPRTAALAEELLAHEWQTAPGGAVQLLSKDDVRKAIGRSPDYADAVVMGLSVTMPSPGARVRVFAMAV